MPRSVKDIARDTTDYASGDATIDDMTFVIVVHSNTERGPRDAAKREHQLQRHLLAMKEGMLGRRHRLTFVTAVVGISALLGISQSCHSGQAASSGPLYESGDVTATPPPGPVEPVKERPTPSACPRLPAPLQSLAVSDSAAPTSYPPSLDIQNDKVRLSLQTSADDRYLQTTYGIEVLFRLDNGRRASVWAPITQLCALSNDPAIAAISVPEPARFEMAPGKP